MDGCGGTRNEPRYLSGVRRQYSGGHQLGLMAPAHRQRKIVNWKPYFNFKPVLETGLNCQQLGRRQLIILCVQCAHCESLGCRRCPLFAIVPLYFRVLSWRDETNSGAMCAEGAHQDAHRGVNGSSPASTALLVAPPSLHRHWSHCYISNLHSTAWQAARLGTAPLCCYGPWFRQRAPPAEHSE